MLELMLTGGSGSTRMNRTRFQMRTMRTTSVTSAVVMAVPAVLVVLETLISRSWVVLTLVPLLDLVGSLAKRKRKVPRVTR